MQNPTSGFRTIDEYIASFPENVQEQLSMLRTTIQSAAPEAEERISYQMPTFFLKGNLVHFAAWKKHIGFYPASRGIDAFTTEFSRYETTKGAVKFPIDQPLPLDLIGRIVRFRVSENLNRAATKSRRKV